MNGGNSKIARQSRHEEKALTTSAATTPETDFLGVAGGTVYIPTGSTITTLTYHAAPQPGGTFLALQDSSGAAVTQTVAAEKAYDMPAAVFGVGALKIVANAAGSVFLSLKG
jgi:hypothetical protein